VVKNIKCAAMWKFINIITKPKMEIQ
jgi:hypothetical protein